MSGQRSDGRVALVTGAGGDGSGTAVVLALAAEGATVIANGLPRHAARLADLSAEHARISAAVADVADEDQVDSMVREIVAQHGRLDILVHNAAGSMPYRPIAELETAAWRGDLGTILDGAFFLSRACAAPMRSADAGRMIFVSSSAAFRGARGRSAAYAAAKAGLHGLVAQLALELGRFGITANAVAPSQIDTPRIRQGGRRNDESLAAYARSVPVGRVGRPDDLAGLVCFLSSAASGYLTGQVIRLDGGSTLASAQTNTEHGENAS